MDDRSSNRSESSEDKVNFITKWNDALNVEDDSASFYSHRSEDYYYSDETSDDEDCRGHR